MANLQLRTIKPILVFQFQNINKNSSLLYDEQQCKWSDDYSYVHTILNGFTRTALYFDENEELCEMPYYGVFQDINEVYAGGWENDVKANLLNRIRRREKFKFLIDMYKRNGLSYRLTAYQTIQEFLQIFNVRKISSSPEYEQRKFIFNIFLF